MHPVLLEFGALGGFPDPRRRRIRVSQNRSNENINAKHSIPREEADLYRP